MTMPPQRAPTYIASVRARRLARTLRDHRKAAGYSQDAVGSSLGWSQQKVAAIETLQRRASLADVRLMLELYGVVGHERDALLTLAREANRRSWWTEHVDILSGPYIPLEDSASEIDDWSPLVVPGILQTEGYARALVSSVIDGEEEIEQRLLIRSNRKNILTRTAGAPTLRAVIDESALRRQVGSAAIMREQLEALLIVARRPNVTVQVMPYNAGTHPGLEGPLIVLRFTLAGEPSVGYVEGFHGATYLESPQKIAECNVAMEGIRKAALDTDASMRLIGELIESGNANTQ